MTHYNLVSTLTSFLYELDAISPSEDDLYIAYLPLAHVLELIGESMMIMSGVAIGYSGPNTLTDKSTMIKRGAKGDATMLRPTIMFCVPLILDRIYKNITEGVNKKGVVFSKIFEICYNYKLWWNIRGFQTPLLERLIFRKLRQLLGGRVDLMIVGGVGR